MTDSDTENTGREHLRRVSLERYTDDPTPGVGIQLSPSLGATIKNLEAGESWSDFTAEMRFYQADSLRRLADKLQNAADWIEGYQDADSDTP